ncbi:MAG: TRAP transporter small permease [Candidatus Rokubacteria bacterium]|nr:TRAP transporter small permease [Candidatus Rokubacteria bacterium]
MRRATVWVFETLAWGLLAAIVTLVALQVVARYVLRISLPWPEELARFLLIWLTFTGAVVGTWQNAHFRVDIIAQRLPPAAVRVLSFAIHGMVCVALLVFVWQSIELTRLTAFMRSTSMEISMAYVYGVLPVSGLFMLAAFLREVVRDVRGRRASAPGAERVG